MKRKIIVILLGLCMIVVVSINYLSTVTFDKDTYEVYPSFLQQYKIKKEFQKVKEDISHIVSSDAMNGYSLSSGDQSLSLDGVEHIYQYFQDKDVCVFDEQKYENFQNKDLFLDFWKTYKDQESSLTIYKILHTGSIERLDLISSKHKLYALTTVFDQQIKISGRLIKSISYDQYGYLLIHYQFCKDEIALGAMQYDYMKIDGIDKQLREYNRKYIEPIGYYCNNLFTTNWDETTLDTIHFNDLVEYLYARDYDRPFPGSTYPNRQNHLMVRSIPSDVYEKLVMDHFALNHEQVKKYSDYDEDTDTYPWIEAYCEDSYESSRFSVHF